MPAIHSKGSAGRKRPLVFRVISRQRSTAKLIGLAEDAEAEGRLFSAGEMRLAALADGSPGGPLPDKGFEGVCFPAKVAKGAAGWCRPVALIQD
mgnify:CR=1 FL=1